jgi:2'-5' RNA ligase
MTLQVAGGGRFDGRVLWAGIAGDVDRLAALAASVQAAARRAGCAVDERRYRAHLTLARARDPVDLRGLAAALGPYAGPAWTARTVALVHSRLGPDPRYDTVEEWALGARG